jgi:flagellar operon protein
VITTIDRIAGGPQIGPLGRPTVASDPSAPASPPIGDQRGALSFADQLAAAGRDRSVTLSNHALRRLEQRQIDLQDNQLERLGRAIDTLAARGGRQSLVMLDQVAYVVHVPSHTVVTAVAPEDNKENVFTQIDSVAIA